MASKAYDIIKRPIITEQSMEHTEMKPAIVSQSKPGIAIIATPTAINAHPARMRVLSEKRNVRKPFMPLPAVIPMKKRLANIAARSSEKPFRATMKLLAHSEEVDSSAQ